MDFYDANAHTFKYDTLQMYVARPFQQHRGQSTAHGTNNDGLFYAGFGNTLYDMHAYHHAGIPLHRTFLIDKQSRIYCLDKDGTANGETTAPAIDNPKEYAQFKGTLFANGYRDDALLPHIRKEA
jgi:hypothetical protein